MTAETPREFGEEIRRERELRDVTREQLALVTKVSVRQIEALETGRFANLPALVFSRGFVRSIAEYLGLDADRTVAAFRAVFESWEAEFRAASSGSLNPVATPLRLSNPRRAVSASTTVRGLAVALALAVVTGAAAFLKSRGAEPRRPAASAAAPARPETGPASLALPPGIAAATVAVPSAPLVARGGGAPAGARSTLSLTFHDDCWTEVTVDGTVVVKELVAKGATREFAGGRSFTLTLGNAGVVDVVLDGRSLEPIGGPGQVVKDYVIEPDAPRGSG
ncbi:MAG TPA: helix-turn-helix domain-containing protein [Thermoanaerobaculia bacterium]|nr:helix-turn-helix domain-containing protein [Thermoanaerobaculia bacterium]